MAQYYTPEQLEAEGKRLGQVINYLHGEIQQLKSQPTVDYWQNAVAEGREMLERRGYAPEDVSRIEEWMGNRGILHYQDALKLDPTPPSRIPVIGHLGESCIARMMQGDDRVVDELIWRVVGGDAEVNFLSGLRNLLPERAPPEPDAAAELRALLARPAQQQPPRDERGRFVAGAGEGVPEVFAGAAKAIETLRAEIGEIKSHRSAMAAAAADAGYMTEFSACVGGICSIQQHPRSGTGDAGVRVGESSSGAGNGQQHVASRELAITD